MEMRIIENASYDHRKMLRSLSLPHVDLKRLKLIKQDSNLSDDSSSGFKDSGIEGGDDNLENSTSEIQADFPSLPSSGIIAPDFPSNGSGMLASEPQSGKENKDTQQIILICKRKTNLVHITEKKPLYKKKTSFM